MKKIVTISFAVLALIIVPTYFTFRIIALEKKSNITKYKYTYNYTDDGINFYKTSNTFTLLSNYKCNNCVIHSINTNFYFKDGITIIKDEDNLITFDFANNKILNRKKYENKTYEYIKTFDEFLLVIENQILKLIDYKEDNILVIDEDFKNKNITSYLKDNILTINTKDKTYNIDTITYKLT